MDSYLICATPRSGSTLLCGLLRSTGVAGRPESYFRRQSVSAYADEWGLARRGDALTEVDGFVRAAVVAGSTGNGVFGARIMWGTMTELTDALSQAHRGGTASALELLTGAFRRTRFLHLRRVDTVAQAVSWARAEQTHYWHAGEEAVAGGQEPHFDRDLIDELVHTITMHEKAWQEWFAGQGLSPYELTYEDLAEDPIGAAAAVLEHLGLVLLPERTITVRDRRQADDLNADWITRYRG
ncbi:Stf0 family sulphotransferase [Microlunatus lacustris]